MKLLLYLCLVWLSNLSVKILTKDGSKPVTKQRSPMLVQCKKMTTSRLARRSSRLMRNHKRNGEGKFNGKVKSRISKIRADMVGIGEEQNCIRQKQRQVRKKYEEIEAQREQLWKQTEVIAKQNAGIQIRLNLMFKLLKARAQNDVVSVAQLTQSLRDLVGNQNEQVM